MLPIFTTVFLPLEPEVNKMQNYNSFVDIRDLKGPWLGLLQITLFCIGGLVIFQLVGVLPLLVLYDIDVNALAGALSMESEDPKFRMALYLVQGLTAFGAFIVAPLFYIARYQDARIKKYFFYDVKHWQPLVYTVFITLCFMVVNSVFIEWNINIKFPEFMQGFENWAMDKEEELKKVTEYLTNFTGLNELLVAMVVVAIIPAVGEELLFRGLIQTRLQRITRNAHAAIWISALIFSAFHLQFYGFVPRLLLGALFGYLFYWSGSLLVPMLAHFVNNGFSLLMIYLYKEDLVGFNIDDTESVPLETVSFFFIIGAALIFFFVKFYRNLQQVDG